MADSQRIVHHAGSLSKPCDGSGASKLLVRVRASHPACRCSVVFDGQVRRLSVIGAAAVVLVLSACTTDPKPAQPSGSPGESIDAAPDAALTHSATLNCDDYIGTDPPSNDLQVVLGVVALPTKPAGLPLQPASTGSSALSPRLFAKSGLLIKAGTDFDIVVPNRVENRLQIGWGTARPSHAVAVRNCADVGNTGWLAFAGGYWLDRPACVTLDVRVERERRSVNIGLGTPCPDPEQP